MKVLHVIPSLSAVHGGPSHAIGVMERALLARGIAVETCTTDDDGPTLHNGKPLAQALSENGVIRRYFRKQSEFYKCSTGLAGWLLRHTRNYDVVHIHALFSFSSLAAAWAARRARVPYVVRPLGTLGRYGIGQRRPWLKRISLQLFERHLLANAAAVHFTSRQEQLEAGSLGLELRGVVLPLGVEPMQPQSAELIRARHPELAGADCLLYLSRIDPKKNLEGLLRAMALCKDELSGLMLLIAGDGDPDYVAQLKRLTTDLGLGHRVVWAGRVDGELKASALAAAQGFVLPSFSENFGIAAAEALQAGLPCVLGQGVALAQDAAAAGAAVVVAPAPADIAEAIRCVMGNEALRSSMGAKATAYARENLSTEAMGHGLAALYSRILAGK